MLYDIFKFSNVNEFIKDVGKDVNLLFEREILVRFGDDEKHSGKHSNKLFDKLRFVKHLHELTKLSERDSILLNERSRDNRLGQIE